MLKQIEAFRCKNKILPLPLQGMRRLKAPQRREQLIEVATRLFAEWGYEATTTAAIAEAAGVTEPILYRHFKSKQEMFIAIVRAMAQQMTERWAGLMQGIENPADQIRRIAQQFPAHVKAMEDAYHVLHGALATSRDRKVIAVLREHYVQIEEFFTRIIIDGQQKGLFRPMDPKIPAWQLVYCGAGYAMLSLNLSQNNEWVIGEAIESILRGITAEGQKTA